MNNDRYDNIEIAPNFRFFTFVSQGIHGRLIKVVTFTDFLRVENTFNLSLGTLLPNGKIDYDTITNNGDRNKILTTVALIIGIFIQQHRGISVYVTGSDKRRTLLYQRAITYGYEELIELFNIYGDFSSESEESKFEPFDSSKNYSGFLIQEK
ncbi:DUF6934 family protein [Mucilaginibacter sp. OK098]|uniref:DUF6934 family protein n=1 Tax=Mucilaginibacter sp. OK098 TaxID=1855297 RepID=UPI00091883AF|nr:hypothetical protein [Mucilaginibacter sp. OK098]SHN17247.1 hypothetical protein SAMN05216524_10692 [Mucilaginibacter sp. OK098]